MSFRFNFGGELVQLDDDMQDTNDESSPLPCLEIPFDTSRVAEGHYAEIPIPQLKTNDEETKPGCNGDLPASVLVKRVVFLQDHKEQSSTGSDLVPGVYEGGRKVWESSVDLVGYLAYNSSWREWIKGKKVLELGCGHGLPGLFSLLMGAAEVHFQDYNADVVKEVTQINALLGEYPNLERLHFFAGDWSTLLECLPAPSANSYDLILTAETIYSLKSLPSLARLIASLLKPKSGRALVAGKTFYFGVGGGFNPFKDTLIRECESMGVVPVVESAFRVQDGKSTVREVW
eukprot:CAMPEP_0184688928 /NCGR_PEP_ID=MMETSP0312-20130426/30366_1 /TAXON_ID=31354 /ORGANISM="Compsopogon coeruleus, Strain SAG 36.94" /LENGTH=288 /DNA_ID=CAMNT_0027146207 /DNA_START=1004 /DNA_END=1867 /DNA_ORIENTATION=+